MKHLFSLLLLCACISMKGQHHPAWGTWTTFGDQGNGTYVNPIIPSDYSDIDCIRVGDDYYAITSTFQFSPGMTIIHSTDLVNWEICGNAVFDLTQIGKELNWDVMDRYNRGIWAGTLRHHEGKFYLFFGTPDEGYFMTSATDPAGKWEPLTPLLLESGWDDCTAMWDEKGKGYFVGTHFADGYKTYLFDMSPDGKSIDRKSARLINEGSGREASKLIKRGDWYYLVFSEHKNGIGRYVLAKRAKKLTGPWKEERQLALASTHAMEPNQGGIVLGKDNRWYFLTHHGSGNWDGRIASLLPVTWIDEWPIIGTIVEGNDGQLIGTMSWGGRMPFKAEKKLTIQRSDDFDNDFFPPQWQWNYQPRTDYFSLTERPGWLRLKAFRPLETNNLMKAGNTLTQRTFRKPSNDVVIRMDISHMTDGQKCGMCHFSAPHSAMGVVKDNGVCYVEYRVNGKVTRGTAINSRHVWIKSVWGMDGKSQYSYSLDGDNFTNFGEPYHLVWGNYRGDRLGIYCFNDLSDTGHVDIDYLHYR